MKKYIVKIKYESSLIEAENDDEALEKFWEKVYSTPQQTLSTFISEYTTVEEKKKGDDALSV